jgi:hypothetical protein
MKIKHMIACVLLTTALIYFGYCLGSATVIPAKNIKAFEMATK